MGCKIFDKLGIGIAIGETVDACRNSKRTFCILLLFISSFIFRECIIVCVKAKFVDTVRARSGHPIGGFIPTWQNAK